MTLTAVPSSSSCTGQTPTNEIYLALDTAFRHFNDLLFERALPLPVVTLRTAGGRSDGCLRTDKFIRDPDMTTANEISLDPMQFASPIAEVMANLVHQMVHLWQSQFGNPSRAGYHNRQWARRMRDAGLLSTMDGTPTGKPTGQSVTQLVAAGGPFEDALQLLIASRFELAWHVAIDTLDQTALGESQKAPGRVKWMCPGCQQLAWAKPTAELACSICMLRLVR
jgi:hypothetical protein